MCMPDLVILASLKTYALERRAKWKDYVDLYSIFQNHSFAEVVKETNEIFKNEFNKKLFWEQLFYFSDIEYSESVDWMSGFAIDNTQIQRKLEEIGLQKYKIYGIISSDASCSFFLQVVAYAFSGL